MAKGKPGQHPRPRSYIIATVLVLLLSLLLPASRPAVASPEEVKWLKVNAPTEGKAGNWVLANGSDLQHLTMAADGTLYAYGKSLTYTLYRSTNGGYSWSYLGNVQDSITAIALAPDASSIYYATKANVYRSTDGGKTFKPLPANPGGAGSNNVEITSIAVARLDSNIIAVGTRDTDNAQSGGVYTLDEVPVVPSWVDTNLGSYDVYAVAFSPNFAADRQLVAVATNETDTFATTKIGDAAWGASIGNARLNKDNAGVPSPVSVAVSATIAFPGDYECDAASASYVQFVAIDTGTGNGDVYRVNGEEAPTSSSATDLNAGSAYGLSNIDITGLAANGDAASPSLLAGAASGAQVYLSTDGGKSWTKSRKEPTGESRTYVLMAPDFNSSGKAYTATSGSESALSVTRDRSVTWNQLGLIDTAISTIVDVAPSPNHSRDNTLFMLTFGDSQHSLWRSLDDGNTWERIFSSALANVDSLKLAALSPRYGSGSKVVFLAGESNGSPATWQSTDSGQNFLRRLAVDSASSTALPIDAWAIVNDNTLLVGSFDGSNSLVYLSSNGGFSYSAGTQAGSQSLNSIALSPNYERDKTTLIGNTNGWVYWSSDNGSSFESLPPDATSPPLTDSITVAFDPEFSSSRIVYAASSTASKGVYRFTIGKSAEWERIDGTLPSGGMLNQIVVSATGTLYAANSKASTGMERCLNPSYPLGPTFETVTRGLGENATLSGLWQNEHRLWSVDTTNIRLMTFIDSLTSPATPASPTNTASGVGNIINHTVSNITIDWKALSGATSYQWQLDHDTNFSTVPDGFEGNTQSSSVRLPTLEPSTKYYWRVRANAPILSPWSAKWSFTTSLDTEPTALKLESPKAGATDVPVRPVFQWSDVAGAEAYELVVSTDVLFSDPSVSKIGAYGLAATAWQSNVSLNYDITYYWKVRAINSSTSSAWSAVGAFTTEQPPPPPIPPTPTPVTPEPSLPILTAQTVVKPSILMPSPLPLPAPANTPLPPPPPPPSPAQTTPPLWVIYIIGGLFLTIILLLVIILVLVAGFRRL